MELSEYQKQARNTAVYPHAGENYIYPTLGLVGEAGEVAEKIKKMLRAKEELSQEKRADLEKELGDVLWYLSQLAAELDISLEDIANTNLEKLYSRQKRDALHGSGDNR